MLRPARVIFISILLYLICLLGVANAGQTPNFFASPNILGASLIAPRAIVDDMRGKRLKVELSPAYWSTGFDGGSADGYGGSIALKYEFSPRWGVSLLGGYGSSNEFSSSKRFFGEPNVPASTKYRLDYSSVVAFALTHDFFSKPGGFRLPISIGVASGGGKVSGEEKSTGYTVIIDCETPPVLSFFVGLTASFNIKDLRFISSLMVVGSGDNEITWRHSDGRVETKSFDPSFPSIVSGSINYAPFNLSYNFQRSANVEDLTIHSLTWRIPLTN
ncbi:MAG: hypothetical protein HY805_10585 [Nitrospirae bacterium]|nr:hypothetical protein [Nitrospirota bacterium]